MNSCQKVFSVCVLALLTQAAFAQSAPDLGTASNFAVLSAADAAGGAVTCKDSTIDGNVGSSGAADSVTVTRCTITGAIVAPVPSQVVDDFDSAYAALKSDITTPCDFTWSGTTFPAEPLLPGVHCFAAAVTAVAGSTLTLSGTSTDVWIFKIGTGGTGALSGTNFTVAMTGGAEACNVTWWVAEAATMTDSDFNGTILAGAAITMTGTAPGQPTEGRVLAKAGVTLTDMDFVGCEAGAVKPPLKKHCNQGVGNGPEFCDPGNSNQGNPFRSNDELGGTPGDPGRKGGNTK